MRLLHKFTKRNFLLSAALLGSAVISPLSLAAADSIEWRLESAKFLEKNYESISTSIELQIAMITNDKYRDKILEQVTHHNKTTCLSSFIVHRAANSKKLEQSGFAVDIDDIVPKDIRQINTNGRDKYKTDEVRLVGTNPYSATLFLTIDPLSESQLAVMKSSFEMMRPLWETFIPVLRDNLHSQYSSGSNQRLRLSGGLVSTRGTSCKESSYLTNNYPHFHRNYHEGFKRVNEESLKPLSISQIEFFSEVLEYLEDTDSLNLDYEEAFGVISSVKEMKLEDFSDLSAGGDSTSDEVKTDEFDDLDLGNIELK